MKYYAFISYSHKDLDWAKWLQHELEYYQLPSSLNGREGLPSSFRPVFRDEDELAGGNLKPQISAALASSEFLIVICSPNSARSEYVNNEITEFIEIGKKRNADYTKRIFPLIVEGKPHQEKGSAIECFSPILNKLKDIEGRQVELIAGDVTATGRNHAFVKILAGTLKEKSVQFSELWNRYEEYKLEEEKRQKEEQLRLYRISARYISEKTKDLISEGKINLAARLLNSIHDKTKDLTYIPEIEQGYRFLFRASFESIKPSSLGSLAIIRNIDIDFEGNRIICACYDPALRIFRLNNGQEYDSIRLIDDKTYDGLIPKFIQYLSDNIVLVYEEAHPIYNMDTCETTIKPSRLVYYDLLQKRGIKHLESNLNSFKWFKLFECVGASYFIISDGDKLLLVSSQESLIFFISTKVEEANHMVISNGRIIKKSYKDEKANTSFEIIDISEASAVGSITITKPNIKNIFTSSKPNCFFYEHEGNIYEYDYINLLDKFLCAIGKNTPIIDLKYDTTGKYLAILSKSKLEILKKSNSNWENHVVFRKEFSINDSIKWENENHRIIIMPQNGNDIKIFSLHEANCENEFVKIENISKLKIYKDKIISVDRRGNITILSKNGMIESQFQTGIYDIYDVKYNGSQVMIISSSECLNVNDDYKKIFGNVQDDMLTIWNVNGELQKILTATALNLEDACFSEISDSIISCSNNGELRYWDIKNLKLNSRWMLNDQLCGNIYHSKLDNYMATVSYDEFAVNIYNSISGKLIRTFIRPEYNLEDVPSVLNVKFHTIRPLMVIAYSDGEILIFNYIDNEIQNTFTSNENISDIEFLSESSITIAIKNRIDIYDFSGVLLERHFIQDTSSIKNIIYDANSNCLFFNNRIGIFRINLLPYDKLVSHFKVKYPDRLTAKELKILNIN